ncbi:MAG TPA: FAD-dependent oxidoreductase [Methylibium sp.]|uniref:FAD-dependent oxidoreductase n=1 Tax=Methylibium sp. TaxID=2067992 RepID=UPI002DBF10D8|nr:FAD-dependent oxidoreductase [Methylibium sp.]HEU4459559.1 FAD-dependent oxidoreductase [Methylibium sp.]
MNPARHPVAVVGAGPVGLSLAIDLAQRGIPVLLLDKHAERSAAGSRAICFAKRTLEVFDRLGCGEAMVAKGVSWQVGRVFFRDEEIYRFDLQPEPGHGRPAFINLQQYHVEAFLLARAQALPSIELRWQHEVVGVDARDDGVCIDLETPRGREQVQADYLCACDGSRSAVRALIGQESRGRVFRDRFLIADVRMKLAQPAERWFWFDPPFHRNGSVLLHMQPDGVWRIDFQLGWDADPEVEKRPENILPRIRALLGEAREFELVWASVYTFACQRMDRFRHGRVLFAGDAAHGVSPFGARGANSGVQDAENLAWKLAAVVQGQASEALLDSYASEREAAADENILHSTRSTDFITPKSEASRLYRDAVLQLAKTHPFARTLVNSGRLSLPATLDGSPLNTQEEGAFAGPMRPGAPCCDAPVERDGVRGWLLRQLRGGFTLLLAHDGGARRIAQQARAAAAELSDIEVLTVGTEADATLRDIDGLVARRYALAPGAAVLIRPDHHVCARWREPTPAGVRDALARALARA